jgi:uncharacterized protein YjdB
MSPILEDILIHGHIVAELDDVEPELRSSSPHADRSPVAEAPRRRAWLSGIQAVLRDRVRAIPVLGALMLLATLACADSSEPLPPRDAVAVVQVAPEQRALLVGETVTLSATPRDAAGRALTGRTVTWQSSDVAIANVAADGRVTALRVGTTTLRATSEGKSGESVVTVKPGPLARLELDPAFLILAPGEARQTTALGYDAAGNVLRLGAVVWTSSNPAVAAVTTVGATGVVTAGVAGTALVTATSEGMSVRAQITVTAPAREPVDRVEVTPTAVVLERGGTRQLTAVLRDRAGRVLTDRAVTWTSDNPMAATVSATGLVTALTPGYATIVATSEGRSFDVAVTVPTPELTEYQLVLVNGTPVPRTLFTTVETGADGVTRTVRWDAYEGYFRLANGRYEQLIGFWMIREGAPAVQAAYVYGGTYLYDMLDGGIVFHPSDNTPAFRGAVVDGTLVVARRLMPGTPELTFLHRQR